MEKQQKNRLINHWKNIIEVFIGYIKLHLPPAHKGNSEFEILQDSV